MAKQNGMTVGLGTSLDQFFTDSPVPRRQALTLSGLRGEVLSFQIAYRSRGFGEVRVEPAGAAAEWLECRRVALAHVEHPTYAAAPEDRIGRAPGFYPDPLLPAAGYPVYPDQTRAIWLTLRIPDATRPGLRRLGLRVLLGTREVARLRVDVRVIDAQLPPQSLQVIHWFHNDCIMSAHRCAAWSSEHWRLAEAYLRNAAAHGVNTITTPVFTPPLDTNVGGERPTVQLVDVTVGPDESYAFDFTRLARWMALSRQCGMTHFEISHLATQWGARCAPKIVATVDGHEQRTSVGIRYWLI